MNTGDGLVHNFCKLSLDDSELSMWLKKKPIRLVMFLEIVDRASKNKQREFGLSKKEYQKFHLKKAQATRIERFLETLIRFGVVRKVGTKREPNTLRTGTERHYSGFMIYMLVNNEFVDLSRTAENAKREPRKAEMGTKRELSREESYKTSTSARAEIKTEGTTIPKKPEETKISTLSTQTAGQLIDNAFASNSFPKIPQKGFSPIRRSELLARMVLLAQGFQVAIRWESYEEELHEAVQIFGEKQVIDAFQEYATLARNKGWQLILWPRFKENKLNQLVTRDQADSIKKLPEYASDIKKRDEVRGRSYLVSQLNDKFFGLADVGVESHVRIFCASIDRQAPDGLMQAVERMHDKDKRIACEGLIQAKYLKLMERDVANTSQ